MAMAEDNNYNSYQNKTYTPKYNRGSGGGGYKKPSNDLSQVKIELNNLKKEQGELKTKVYSMEQFFVSEKPSHSWKRIEIVFVNGSMEEFRNIIARKYTLEAIDAKDNKVIIQKANCLYTRILDE
jgi:hypothetical protein